MSGKTQMHVSTGWAGRQRLTTERYDALIQSPHTPRAVRDAFTAVITVFALAGCAGTDSGSNVGTGPADVSTSASPTTSTTSEVDEPTNTTPGLSTAPAATGLPTPSSSESTNSNGDDLNTIPPDSPGGSAIAVTTPCDSGTSTLSAYPEGAGVAMTETLRGVSHRTWSGYAFVTPTIALQRDPEQKTYTASDGVITIKATNLKDVADGVNYTWPQRAEVSDLSPQVGVPTCYGAVYLGSIATADMHNLLVETNPSSGEVSVSNAAILPGGTWLIRVDATSPSGTQRKVAVVQADKTNMGGLVRYRFAADVSGFTDLKTFTRVRVTATNTKRHIKTWLTMTRTP
jgi:hypothetical protein